MGVCAVCGVSLWCVVNLFAYVFARSACPRLLVFFSLSCGFWFVRVGGRAVILLRKQPDAMGRLEKHLHLITCSAV